MNVGSDHEKLYWLWMLSHKDIGSATFHLLIKHFHSPKTIYEANEFDYKQIKGLKEKSIARLSSNKNLDQAKKAMEYLEKHQINLLVWHDKYYPEKLKMIYRPPIALFTKGNRSLFKQPVSIGIVGSRKASSAGLSQAKQISKELGDAGITIISGLARGIDATAHVTAIKTVGSTIAVLGSGINVCYPSNHKKLYQAIIKNDGLIVSELFLDSQPLMYHFPMRNRIISGLSEGILVVESSKKSGALITAKCAMEQGKNVYAIPKDITLTQGEGNNQLLKDGAKLVTSAKDILEDYVCVPNHPEIQRSIVRENEIELTGQEKELIKWIKLGYDSIDRLEMVSGMDIATINGLLSMMELKEILSVEYGNIQLLKLFREM